MTKEELLKDSKELLNSLTTLIYLADIHFPDYIKHNQLPFYKDLCDKMGKKYLGIGE